MTERKKRPQVVEENVRRPLSDDFTDTFLALCEKYDVNPLPRIRPLGVSSIPPETSRQSVGDEDDAPVIYTTYENPKHLENLQKIECKGYEVSVCLLDALSLSVKNISTLTTIRLPNCGINAYGISQIAQILVEIGCVRDLNLDMNPNIRENYHMLCNPLTKLQFLSLKYCNVSDAGVARIADELRYKGVEESPQLIGLDLANNCIGDNGARCIADMLHTNRSLQSLILTGNRIGDTGAVAIIQELCMYSLTHDEIVQLRRLNYSQLMQRDSRSQSAAGHPNSQERSSRNESSKVKSKTSRRSVSSRKSTNIKRSISGNNTAKIEEAFSEIHSTVSAHPLSLDSRPVGGDVVARGNFELQHLNLSYNHLTDDSLKKIVKCLSYQNYMTLGDMSKGLLHVCLEGNDFQIQGNENWGRFQDSLALRRSSSQSQDINMQNNQSTEYSEWQTLREKFIARSSDQIS